MSSRFVIVALLSFFLFSVAADCTVNDSQKVDCGYTGITQGQCESSGCCWSPAGQSSSVPWCFRQNNDQNYALSNLKSTNNGFTALLTALSTNTLYGETIPKLALTVFFETEDIVRVKITDSNNERWEIPQYILMREDSVSVPKNLNYDFKYTESPFTFEVIRKSDNFVIFQSNANLMFKDQYLELTTTIQTSSQIFGLGESVRPNQILSRDHTYTMWASDTPAAIFNTNLYGSYPFFIQLFQGQASGAMLLNSNGLDVYLGQTSLTYKAIGGIIDLYVFNGPTPKDVVAQMTSVVGRPSMVPYWSLGFHNCKYGYTSIQEVEIVVENYKNANIPLETQWVDIDYMQNYRDFTTDSVNFPVEEVKSFVDKLHSNGQHFVPIIDPGIMTLSGYDAYERGMELDIFIKDISGKNYLGQVWPGPTYFPDFFNPKTLDYWKDQIEAFHNAVPVDGLWIDMNEVSNFCSGQVCDNSSPNGCPAPGASQTDCCLSCATYDNGNKLDFPPYNIANNKGALSTNTLAASSYGYNNISTYNSHNLYGLSEQIATNAALASVSGKRPFLLSRSGFLGTGGHSAKWTGDNAASWDDLRNSITGITDFNYFGVPMVGADVCGFLGDSNEELCARWASLGAFYTFFRNHNTLGAKPQEFYLWPSVTEAAKKSISMRYKLLPTLYSLFYNFQTNGRTVISALWMNFPNDTQAILSTGQFMWGESILISPVISPGVETVNAYFPKGVWYNLFDLQKDSIDCQNQGEFRSLDTPLTDINVHLRGGNVIATQESEMTTSASRKTPFTFISALKLNDENNNGNILSAEGELFVDDGEQINIDNFIFTKFNTNLYSNFSGYFQSKIVTNTFNESKNYKVENVLILGNILKSPSNMKISTSTSTTNIANKNVVYVEGKSLEFNNLGLTLDENFVINWD